MKYIKLYKRNEDGKVLTKTCADVGVSFAIKEGFSLALEEPEAKAKTDPKPKAKAKSKAKA